MASPSAIPNLSEALQVTQQQNTQYQSTTGSSFGLNLANGIPAAAIYLPALTVVSPAAAPVEPKKIKRPIPKVQKPLDPNHRLGQVAWLNDVDSEYTCVHQGCKAKMDVEASQHAVFVTRFYSEGTASIVGITLNPVSQRYFMIDAPKPPLPPPSGPRPSKHLRLMMTGARQFFPENRPSMVQTDHEFQVPLYLLSKYKNGGQQQLDNESLNALREQLDSGCGVTPADRYRSNFRETTQSHTTNLHIRGPAANVPVGIPSLRSIGTLLQASGTQNMYRQVAMGFAVLGGSLGGGATVPYNPPVPNFSFANNFAPPPGVWNYQQQGGYQAIPNMNTGVASAPQSNYMANSNVMNSNYAQQHYPGYTQQHQHNLGYTQQQYPGHTQQYHAGYTQQHPPPLPLRYQVPHQNFTPQPAAPTSGYPQQTSNFPNPYHHNNGFH